MVHPEFEIQFDELDFDHYVRHVHAMVKNVNDKQTWRVSKAILYLDFFFLP